MASQLYGFPPIVFQGLGHSGSVPDFGAEPFARGMCYGPLLRGWEGDLSGRNGIQMCSSALWQQRIISSPLLREQFSSQMDPHKPSKLQAWPTLYPSALHLQELMAHKPYAYYFVVLFSRGMLRDPRFAQILLSTGADLHLQHKPFCVDKSKLCKLIFVWDYTECRSGRIASICNQHKDYKETHCWNYCRFHLPLPNQDIVEYE